LIIGTIITYNDMPLVQDCIKSIIDKVDRIVVVDGKYTDFPGDCFYSTDGTLEYLESLDKVELVLMGGATEVEKRNAYFSKCHDGDVIINLDSDEVLIGNMPPLTSDFGIVDLHDGHSKHIQKRATRFFRFREGMRYENVHYTLYWNGQIINKLNEVINKNFSFEYIKDFHLVHNWHFRPDERKHNKSIYYKKLVRAESGFVK
jgi:glycosyltransferase involved in cell wall biosynthesis